MASDNMKVSTSDMKMMKMMKNCSAMGHDKMMAEIKCKMMLDAHPVMTKSDGMMNK